MKSSGTAYLLALIGFLTPCAGVHRFYLNRPISGFFYLITWGLLGIGTFIDLFLIPRMVEDENRRYLFPGPIPDAPALGSGSQALARVVKAEIPLEHHILRVAQANEGIVTVEMVALQSGISLRKAKKELEQLRREGYCSVDVSTEGAKLYVFDGLRSSQPIDVA